MPDAGKGNRRRTRAARPAVIAQFAVGFDMRVTENGSKGAPVSISTMREFRTLISTEHSAKCRITPSPPLFRRLVAAGLIDELHLSLQPRLVGSKSTETITGLAGKFLLRGIGLDLISARRRGGQYLATYRVRGSRHGRI